MTFSEVFTSKLRSSLSFFLLRTGTGIISSDPGVAATPMGGAIDLFLLEKFRIFSQVKNLASAIVNSFEGVLQTTQLIDTFNLDTFPNSKIIYNYWTNAQEKVACFMNDSCNSSVIVDHMLGTGRGLGWAKTC